MRRTAAQLTALLLLGAVLLALGLAIGSMGWSPWTEGGDTMRMILWDIRAPRSLGAWLAGALLALAGAIAQGLFRNPLAASNPPMMMVMAIRGSRTDHSTS